MVPKEGAAAFQPKKEFSITVYREMRWIPTDLDYAEGFIVPEGYYVVDHEIRKGVPGPVCNNVPEHLCDD